MHFLVEPQTFVGVGDHDQAIFFAFLHIGDMRNITLQLLNSQEHHMIQTQNASVCINDFENLK